MNFKRITLNLIFISFLLAGYVISFSNVKTMREDMADDTLRAEALMVSPTLLKTISGEFKGLWADYLLLKAAAFLGGYRKSTTEDWETLYLLFKQSLTLDPWFFTTCYYVQGILTFRKNMGEKSIGLLKISAEHRDWDWQPNFYIGFDYFYFLKDDIKASEYLGKAAKMPGAPPIVATLGARLAQGMGKTEDAISILYFMYDRTDDKWLRELLEKRIQAHMGMLILERSIIKFEKKYGKRPSSLNELVEKGIVKQLPKNPFVRSYAYKNGRLGLGF